MSPEDRRHVKRLILWAAPLLTLACGGEGGTDVVLPSLRVTTATSGVEIDADGYGVSIDGRSVQPIGVNSTFTADALTDGQHSVELSGLATNCSVQGENPQPVSVVAGATATAAFVIICGSGMGTLQVTTATAGTGTDPDGFTVVLDGSSAGAIGASSTTTLGGISAGAHVIELTGLAVNCEVLGENPRQLMLAAGGTVPVEFAVTCTLPGPNTGTIDVVVTTGGGGSDPDGFSIVLDGTDRGPIGLNATSTLVGIPSGTHAVGLTGVAANCGVSPANPSEITVQSGVTARVEFTVTCAAPGPTTGTLEVVTTTSGGGTDPDGFSLLLDGIDRGPIGINTTSRLAALASGPHTIGLTGLAANCQVTGENPRPVSVPAGGTVAATFSVTCTVPGPTTGTLRITTVTTGSAPDPDGYVFSVDAGAGRPIGANAIVALANISQGQHTVELQGLAPNCSVTGNNPLGAAVGAGETARVAFTVTCTATSGGLRVTVSGLPTGVSAAVAVTGPNSFSQTLTATRTLENLVPGTYGVSATQVVSGNTTYTPSVARPSVDVIAGATAAITVSYTGASNATLNLRIDGMYLTQSTQTYDPSVPLVSGRNGYLRVFVVANESNTARPAVRVRLSNPERTLMITAPGPVPTRVDEGSLASSWNIEIPAASIQPGLAITAELDPDNEIKETNENDNRFPATGAKTLAVQSVPAAKIRFISVQQGSEAPGDVSNTGRLVDIARRLHPLNSIDIDVDPAPFPTGALGPGGEGWGQMLSDLDGKRVAEGSDRIYYGVVKLGYGRETGLVGLTLGQGVPTAAGWDDVGDAGRVVAHELGHVWGRKHSPCGGPPDVDGSYPYSNGRIGVFGMDVAATALKPPLSPDIMSYCFSSPWISDYTYTQIMRFRTSNTFVTAATQAPQPSMLVWGRLVNGQPVLEPAFQITARPRLPRGSGPYTVTATTLQGSELFRLSFDVAVAEDGPAGNGHFAFTVPLDQGSAERLQSLRLTGPSGSATASLRHQRQVRLSPAEEIVARREGASVSLRWDAAVYPMIMVRDPDTGEVLSFARGGSALIQTAKGHLDLEVSDGIRSQRVRLAISRS
jgi:hypothetical protein